MEVYHENGKTITAHDEETKKIPPKYHAAWLGLTYSDRKTLYDRIDRRVEIMLEQGLEREVKKLLSSGIPATATAMQAIGYKEFTDAMAGKISMQEAVEAVQQSSRRYAKRQLTWFRRNEKVFWLDRSNLTDSALLEAARQYLRDFDGAN